MISLTNSITVGAKGRSLPFASKPLINELDDPVRVVLSLLDLPNGLGLSDNMRGKTFNPSEQNYNLPLAQRYEARR